MVRMTGGGGSGLESGEQLIEEQIIPETSRETEELKSVVKGRWRWDIGRWWKRDWAG